MSQDKKGIFQALVNTQGWEELERYAEKERDLSFKRQDDKPIGDLHLPTVAEERGIRKGMLKIIQYARQQSEGI